MRNQRRVTHLDPWPVGAGAGLDAVVCPEALARAVVTGCTLTACVALLVDIEVDIDFDAPRPYCQRVDDISEVRSRHSPMAVPSSRPRHPLWSDTRPERVLEPLTIGGLAFSWLPQPVDLNSTRNRAIHVNHVVTISRKWYQVVGRQS